MDERMGNRLKQTPALTSRVRQSLMIMLACVACFANPGSQSRSLSLYGSMHIHSGAVADFGVACYEGLEAIDYNEKRDVAAELRRRLKVDVASLDQCKSHDGRRLLLSYQAGRGVCIDCAAGGSDWSGFAFITVNDAGGNEIARAEWTGGGGSDGIQLIDRFADDLLALVNEKKSQQ